MSTPLIGITTYRSTRTTDYGQQYAAVAISEHYVRAITQAGGLPLLIPLSVPDHQLDKLIPRLDGVLLTGGGDIDPARYGTASTPEVNGIQEDRDRVEIRLVRTAVSEGLPFLGICRGIQVVNVAQGGTLYTDVSAQHPDALKHDYYTTGGSFDHFVHAVRVAPASQLAAILGTTEIRVNSLHHQGIRTLAPGLRATSWAPDELIESLELPEHPFGMAVQWHPEWLTHLEPMRAIFRAFVEAAAQ